MSDMAVNGVQKELRSGTIMPRTIADLVFHLEQVQGILNIFELSGQKRRLNRDEELAVQVLINMERFLEEMSNSLTP